MSTPTKLPQTKVKKINQETSTTTDNSAMEELGEAKRNEEKTQQPGNNNHNTEPNLTEKQYQCPTSMPKQPIITRKCQTKQHETRAQAHHKTSLCQTRPKT